MSWLTEFKKYTILSVYLTSFYLHATDIHVNVNVLGPACTINDGYSNEVIEVDLGDQIRASEINGRNYDKTFLVGFNCTTSTPDNIFIKIEGEQWSSKEKNLKTSKENLSIKFLIGTEAIDINTKIALESRRDWYAFHAIPIKSGTGKI